MNEEIHAGFVSSFTELLVSYGKFLENAEKYHMDTAGQYLINPTEENKNKKELLDKLATEAQNILPCFVAVQKIEEKLSV
jgi:hypothetical protein